MIKYIHKGNKYDLSVDKNMLCQCSIIFKTLFASHAIPKIYSHANIDFNKFKEFMSLTKKLINNDDLVPHDYVNDDVKYIKCENMEVNHKYKLYINHDHFTNEYLHVDLMKIEEYILIANIYYIDIVRNKLLNFVSNILKHTDLENIINIEYYYNNDILDNIDINDIKSTCCLNLINKFKCLTYKINNHEQTNEKPERFTSHVKLRCQKNRITTYNDLKIINPDINNDLKNRLKKQLNIWYDIIPWNDSSIVFTGGLLVDIIQNKISSDYKDIDLFLIGTEEQKKSVIEKIINNLTTNDHEIYYDGLIVQILIKNNKRCLQLICTNYNNPEIITNLFDASHLKMYYHNETLMMSEDCIVALESNKTKIYEYRPIRVAKAMHNGFEIDCEFNFKNPFAMQDIINYFELIKSEHRIIQNGVKCTDLKEMYKNIKYNGEFDNYIFLSIVDSMEFDVNSLKFRGPHEEIFDTDYTCAFIMYNYYGQRTKRLYLTSNLICSKNVFCEKDGLLIKLDTNNTELINIFETMDCYLEENINNLIINPKQPKYMKNATYKSLILSEDNCISVKFETCTEKNEIDNCTTSVFVNKCNEIIAITELNGLKKLIKNSSNVKVIIEVSWLQGLLSETKHRNYEMILKLKQIHINEYTGNVDALPKICTANYRNVYDTFNRMTDKFTRVNELDEVNIGFCDNYDRYDSDCERYYSDCERYNEMTKHDSVGSDSD